MFTKSKFKFAFEQFFFVLRIGRLLWFEIPEDEEMPSAVQLLDEKARGRVEIREASEIEKTELGQVLNVFKLLTPGRAIGEGEQDQTAHVAFTSPQQLKLWIDSITALIQGKAIKPQTIEDDKEGDKKKKKDKDKKKDDKDKEEKDDKDKKKDPNLIDLVEMNLSTMSLAQLQAALVLKGRKKKDVERKARDNPSAIALLLYAMSEAEIAKKISNLGMEEELDHIEKTARRMKVLEKIVLEGDVGDNEEI